MASQGNKSRTSNATRKKSSSSSAKSGRTSTKKKSTVRNSSGNSRRASGSTNKARSTSNRKQNIEYDENDYVISNDIKIITAFVITLLLTLSNFSLIGSVGDSISRFMFGIFGLVAYVMPILLFIGICFVIANIGSRRAMRKLKGFIILIIALCTFLQLIYSVNDIGFKLSEIYSRCAEIKNGGGILGGLFAFVLHRFIGVYGAFIVDIAVLIISFVIISEKSFVNQVKNHGRNAYAGAKEDFRRMKENSARRLEREEANRMTRVNNQVRGVDLSSKVTDEGQISSDIHQLVNQGILYQGHVDINEIEAEIDSSKEQNNKNFYERLRNKGSETNQAANRNIEISQNINTTVEPNRNINRNNEQNQNVKNVNRNVELNQNVNRIENDVLALEEQKKINEDVKNGEFAPKEQIIVSKSAREAMARKPFSGTNMAPKGNSLAKPDNSVRENTIKEISNTKDAPDVKESVTVSAVSSKNAGPGIKSKDYIMPPISLLNKGTTFKSQSKIDGMVSDTAIKLQETLDAFGVKATVVDESRGPSVTRYELQPETGTKVSKITSLADDIKLNLAAADIRIEAPIPGKAAVGIEVPNAKRESVFLRDLIESEELSKHPSKLAFAAGMDIAGKVIVADIAKMPHMLVAGTTGSGKSVFTNSIIMSILFRAKPSEVKLIIVDPKVVEFGVYNGIPHLLTPVVTDPRKAAGALNWAVGEMQDRYAAFSEYHVRDLKGYNEKVESMGYRDGDKELSKKPQIVIIIDELADLMMVASKEVEASICRLAQLARAAGIHLIIATQRPSVDVVTGLIKANIPSRVSLLVSSGVDSRTVIDCNGGEKLLGNGDMLFYPSGYVKPVRLQGAFVSDGEVQNVVQFLIDNNQDVQYDDKVANAQVASAAQDSANQSVTQNTEDDKDVLYEQAARFVIEKEKASTSMLQRMFKIGFNRAARIVDTLESDGIVGPDEGTKPRKVLMTINEFERFLNGETISNEVGNEENLSEADNDTSE